jgi:hypothetical protein
MPANHYNRGHVQKNLDRKTWKLSEQGAYDYAVRLFGATAIESLPKLERGPNKGKPKGFLHWRKATAAGYYRECAGPCKAGGLIDAWIGEHFGTLRDGAMRGMWCGRIQALAGSRSVLTAEYRELEERNAREHAEAWERTKAKFGWED